MSSLPPNVGRSGDHGLMTDLPVPAFESITFEIRLLQARLERAEQHYLSFGRIWSDYLDTRPHELGRVQEANGTLVIRLRRTTPIPVDLSIVFGELLYELRAALDNCLYAVAVLVSGQNPPPSAGRLEWPIRFTSADWKSQAARYRHLPPKIVEALEAIQPYQAELPEWNSLGILHELARLDRHRSPHGLGLYLSHIHLFAEYSHVEVVDLVRPGIVREGDELARLLGAEGTILSPDNFDLNLEFEVEVPQICESPGPDGVPGRPWGSLDNRLKSLIDAAHEYTSGLLDIAATCKAV